MSGPDLVGESPPNAMRLLLDRATIGAALAVLVLSCFGAILFRDEQFVYRDAGNYYYPLHARTAAQWGAGLLPLWDPDENGGLPLLGNPTAAVLYPGKLVFAVLPYPWAARFYLIAHVGLAVGAMVLCLRGLGVSRVGAAIGGLSYGFGGPVLLQYSNAIYLVGAAWLPLGLLAADAWLRRGRPRAIAGLAFVLAMQILGGDIQVAYVLGMFAASYAAWLVVGDRVAIPPAWKVVAGVAAWVVGVPFLAAWLPALGIEALPPDASSWISRALRVSCWLAGMAILTRMARERRLDLAWLLGGLLLAAIVAAALSAAQLLPVAELSSLSFRMAEDLHMDPYGFSLEPYRPLEFLWPGLFGIEYPEDRLWLLAIPPDGSHAGWVPTLYLGALPVLLAIAGISGKGGPGWHKPMAATVIIGLLLSFGRLGSPLWWFRCWPPAVPILGGHGINGPTLFRAEDGLVRDAFGSPYWLMATLAPGFGSFRFPSKQLVFVAMGVSALAGLGWDRLASGETRPGRKLVAVVAGLSLVAAVSSFAFQGAILGWLSREAKVPSISGPIDPRGALLEFRRALLHAGIAFGAATALVFAAARGRTGLGPFAVAVLAIDLALANGRFVWSIPQATFEGQSRVADLIAEAEKDEPFPGPFRIQRLPEWHPLRWVRTRSPARLEELAEWQIDTVQSGYGMLHGVSYVLTPGVLEPEKFLDIFDPTTIALDAPGAAILNLDPGRPIRYYPRRAFDLWGARYFVIPRGPYNWLEPNRAIASFLPNSEVIYPRPADLESAEFRERWDEDKDWQLLRNPSAFPRAWVVHDVRVRPGPIRLGSPEDQAIKRSLLYQADPFWAIPGRQVDDPRVTAWVEADPGSLGRSFDGAAPGPKETVTVVRERPGRVELLAILERDGLVVLAEQDYPGWTLEVDGTPAPILRTNLAMRGAVVTAGRHELVFSYEPGSLRAGLGLMAAGLIATAALLFLPNRDRGSKR